MLSTGSRSARTRPGQRIDNFLLRILKGVPKSHIYRILRSGEVRVNKGRVGPDARLAPGDVVRVPPVRTAAPARIAASPAARRVGPAADPVRGRRPDRARQAGRARRARRQRHRARRSSSSCARRARTRGSSSSCIGSTATRRACCWSPRSASALVGAARAVARRRDRQALSRAGARAAGATRKRRCDAAAAQVLDAAKASGACASRTPGQAGADDLPPRRRRGPTHDPPLALLEAELETGRTHQIRVHLAHLGFPLGRRRQVRRLRVEPGACEGKA